RMLEAGGRYGGLETVLVARDPAGYLVAACKNYRLEEYIAGAAMPMLGLAAVAVAPSHRRRGLGARICTAAIHTAVDRGEVVSVLYPFRPDYYERLGWGLVGSLHEYRFRTSALGPTEEVRYVRRAAIDQDAAPLAACYGRVAACSNGPIRRDRQVWAYRLYGEELGVRPLDAEAVWTARADPKLRAIVFDDDRVSGYALLRYVQKASPEQHTLQVRELMAEDERAYRGLLGYIAGQHDQWPLARHYARPGERFGDRLREPRPPGFRGARSLYFPTARVVRGPMLRVLDVPAALRARPLFDAGGPEPITFTLTIADDQRPANAGPWTVRVDEDGGNEVTEGTSKAADASLQTDASTFARIFAGEISVTDAVRVDRARASNGTGLDRVFATREEFWLLDEF
ncbi:MAG: GNAT family N-acetyltransferase, partial [Gemmatimonadetes bacterium]|nr:GNAT family N-acetyltransferase [Gemmatimonadota bacterium]NIQ57593.1 GNAT family N-acetyltransferase [Gemmatimonadota bacterium]NIU77759.1 GNAT family N-acetyltransferase [Gammaproteobacteria bacterium]NIX46897.1 GNAT family N-acetyltransferase [Gemmatimonadota bacterium]NIY11248.1 GNAT family N-acetyltransferase [Gemmatimonadota bacterium]